MKNTRPLLMNLFTLPLGLLIACGTAEDADQGPGPVGPIDDDPPLSAPGAVRMGAPKDDSIEFEGKADTILPSSFDIVSLQTPVRNQSRRGVCSIFSTVGLMEMLFKKAGMATPDFSEQYLQWAVKVQYGAFSYTDGSSDSANLATVARFGIPVESAWPYNPNPWTEADDPACKTGGTSLPTKCYTQGDPPAAARSAKKYMLSSGRWVSTKSIKNVIFEKKQGVLVGLDFFYQAWNHRRSTLPTNPTSFAQGYVLYPNSKDQEESYKSPAGHSVQLVGWDDNLELPTVDAQGKPVLDAQGRPVKEKGFYLFKNSWGTTGFGVMNKKGAGYGWISYRYVSSFGSGYTADRAIQ